MFVCMGLMGIVAHVAHVWLLLHNSPKSCHRLHRRLNYIIQRRVQFWHSGLLFKQHDTLLKIEINRLYKTTTCTGCIFLTFLNLRFQTPHMSIQYPKRCCFFPMFTKDKQICLIIPSFGNLLNNQTVLWNTSTHPHFFYLSKAGPFWQVTGHVWGALSARGSTKR